jgi:serine/threonine protein kinase
MKAYRYFPFGEDEWKERHPQVTFPELTNSEDDDEDRGKMDRLRSFLGKGSFGVVRRMQKISDGSIVAVKEVSLEGTLLDDVKRESEILKTLRHRNIIEYRDLIFRVDSMHLVMEYAETSLAVVFQRDAFDEKIIIKIVKGIASALDYMHGRGVIHRDLKLENILINDGDAKLADFGLSTQTRSSLSLRSTLVGTIVYLSPERANSEKYGPMADMWAVGCIIWEVSVRRRVEVDFWKNDGTISKMVSDCQAISPVLAKQVALLLQPEPLQRISALSLRIHLDQASAETSPLDSLPFPTFRWDSSLLAGHERREVGAGFKVGYYTVSPGSGRASERLLADAVLEYVESSDSANRGALPRRGVAGVAALDSEPSSAHFRLRVAKLQESAAGGWRRPPFSPDWDEHAFTRYPGDRVEQAPADIERRQRVARALDSRPDRLGAGPGGGGARCGCTRCSTRAGTARRRCASARGGSGRCRRWTRATTPRGSTSPGSSPTPCATAAPCPTPTAAPRRVLRRPRSLPPRPR